MKPVAPKSSWQLVSVGDAAQVPVVTTEPFDVPEPAPNPYNDYLTACGALRVPGMQTEYAAGFLTGVSILTGGMTPGVATGKVLALLQSSAAGKGKANFGQGATDAWRMIAESKSFTDVRNQQ